MSGTWTTLRPVQLALCLDIEVTIEGSLCILSLGADQASTACFDRLLTETLPKGLTSAFPVHSTPFSPVLFNPTMNGMHRELSTRRLSARGVTLLVSRLTEC